MPLMSIPSERLQTLWISSDDIISDNDLDALLRLIAVHAGCEGVDPLFQSQRGLD